MRNPSPQTRTLGDFVVLLIFLFMGGFLFIGFVFGFLFTGRGPQGHPASVASATPLLTPDSTWTAFSTSPQVSQIPLPTKSDVVSLTPTWTRIPSNTPTQELVYDTGTPVQTATKKPVHTDAINTPTATSTVTITPASSVCFLGTISGINPSDDTYINAEDADTVYSSQYDLFASANNGGNQRVLIKFDLTSFTSITNAKLYLYVKSTSPSVTISLYRVIRNWKEAEATWNEAASAQLWDTAGGDFKNNPVISFTPDIASYCYMQLDVTSLVQSWVTSSYPNYGVILIATGPRESQTNFAAKEGPSDKKPVLSITP